ncbi:oligosaccharide flippase family protein [Metallosphaera tengchongensis]|uniref:Oligosaccharide flippase family protein n=1 Tax=Metallosphaera tengchongensis TaxID=1532350 RepID=A0A6N0NYG0_9CREN|nr:oligosaccharide flippase family protein [Metallosphaera tengchongensis]QKR00843.1 oligosaccharide flippase family protein [Metallosphaera tengchongensis]
MNPVKNWLKSLSVTTVNVIVALVFFVITARITNPQFFGKVAIIQLLEVIVFTVFFFIPNAMVTREVAYAYAKNEHKAYVAKFLAIPFLAIPFLLVLLLFPTYVGLAIPYLFLYLFGAVQSSIMLGMDMFTENAITGITFLIIRWGVAIIAVLLHDIYMFIGIWTVGGVVSVSLNYIFLTRRLGGPIAPHFDFYFLGRAFRGGLPLFLSSSASFLSSQGDRVTTAYLLGSYYLGVYQFSALVASVPLTFLSSLSNVILPAASFYKALGKDERRMSSISFRVISFLTLLVIVLSVPLGEIMISHLFPEYAPGIPAFVLLFVASVLAFPIGSLTNFIIAFKRDLRPFLVLILLNASTVLFTSFLLIPRIGIIGGAISQVIVAIVSSLFTIFYALRTKVFFPTLKDYVVLSLLPLVGVYEVFIDPKWLDVVLFLALPVIFKFLGIIERSDVELIRGFLPRRLMFIYQVLRILS